LKGSTIVNSSEVSSYTNTTLFFQANNKGKDVRSIEDAIVQTVAKIDSSFIIITQGQNKIAYGNLSQVYVHEGEHVKKKQPIGAISQSAMSPDNDLTVDIKYPNGSYATKKDFRN
jgi:hypothetical protein